MATTNFGNLNTNQLTAWSRDLWKAARENSFTMRFAGKGPNAPIQRITELTKSQKGTRAIISLVADLTGDGVVGDHTLEDKEESINAYDLEVTIDQLRNANRTAGRVQDQKTIVNFRNTSKDVLGYWLGDRIDQMSFLTLSGMSYALQTNGALRPVLETGMNLTDLDFADEVSTPTTLRHRNWGGEAKGLLAGSTTAATADLAAPSYAMLVQAKAYAKDHYIRGIKGKGNSEFYHVFMCPQSVAKLKLDDDFRNAVNNGGVRGNSNPTWTGSIPTVDGLVIHEFRHVPNTAGAVALDGTNDGAAGAKWGTNADTPGGYDGAVVLFVGAQALAMADIGMPYWEEDEFDYGNQIGISVGKMFGLRKPKFYSNIDAGVEDFGVLRINCKL